MLKRYTKNALFISCYCNEQIKRITIIYKFRRVYSLLIVLIVSLCGFLIGCGLDKPQIEAENNWTSLFDKDLSKWNIFVGVPHASVDLPGYPKDGTPIGLN